MIAVGGHYGVTVATCVPADPESKGGSEATVRVAKADLVPTDANLLADYGSWGELVEACEAFMAEVNGREHRATRRAPADGSTRADPRFRADPRSGLEKQMSTTPKASATPALSPHHVALSVGDLDTAASWYREVLGLRDVVEYPVGDDDAKAIMLERDGFAVELFWSPGSAPRVPPSDPVSALAQRGLTHVGLGVANVSDTYSELRRRGVTFVVPPTEYVEGVPVAFFRDPEGNLYELFPRH